MSLQPVSLDEIPAETVRVARAAFPKGSLAMRLRDELGSLYADADFAALYPRRGQPAASPGRLALVLVLQYVEGLTDRQAAAAVRGRLDWKYALGLELTDPGVDASVLAEFRARLVASGAEQRLLEALLAQCQARGWLKAGGAQRTDSTHVLAAVRALNRLECVGETLRAALNALAVAAPEWLRPRLEAAWVDRYQTRFAEERLPQAATARQALATQIGTDGLCLLAAIDAEAPFAGAGAGAGPDPAWAWLRTVPAIQVLRRVWWQQFQLTASGAVAWRTPDNLPPASQLICTPYDPEARLGRKREVTWIGAKVHLTETHDPARPHLVTQVTTTPAPVPDAAVIGPIQADLAAHDRLPAVQRVDAGYVDGANLVASQERTVDLLGPAPRDTSWQAAAGAGFALADFAIDWAAEQATCPAGQPSVAWTAGHNRHGAPVITVAFPAAACQGCAHRVACTKAARGPRKLTLRPQAEHEALQAARQRQADPAFAAAYASRAGIEGTISQGVRAGGLRRARYVGLAKLHLEHLLIATALDVKRLAAWWTGDVPEPTRHPPLVALLAAA